MRIRFHNLDAFRIELVRRGIKTVWWDVRKEMRAIEDIMRNEKVVYHIVLHNLVITASDGKDLLYAVHTILSYHSVFQGNEKIKKRLADAIEKAKRWVEREFPDFRLYQGEIIEV